MNTLRLGFALLLAGSLANAQDAAATLGEAYTKASPAEQCAQLSIARTDKVLKSGDVSKTVNAIAKAYVAPGETAKDRLTLLGKLRTDTKAVLDTLNAPRKEAKKRSGSLVEPDSRLQQAIALDYMAETVGDLPTVEELKALKLVRDCTSWSALHKLVLAFVQEALDRDEAFAKADTGGKLAIVKNLAVEVEAMSNQERQYVENAILHEWISAGLAAKTPISELRERLKKWKDGGSLCFFSHSQCDGALKKLEELRSGN